MSFLTLHNLSVSIGTVHPLDGISLEIDKGQILGVVGESGSGKSITAMAIMGLLPLIGGRVSGGSITLGGTQLVGLREREYRKLRGGRMALITQNPMTSLDPLIRVGAQVDQVSRLHLGLPAAAAKAKSIELLAELRIPDAASVYHQYPHQLSGGMKQRIVIAMALAGDPELIIADEPTTALDVTIQAQIIQILAEMVRDRGMALVLITHDMGVVAQACDRVVVLYAGRVAEANLVHDIFDQAAHPYTQALIRCIPSIDQAPGSLKGIPGMVPSVADYEAGCRYHSRCERAQAQCTERVPALATHGEGLVACHFAGSLT
jgi:oligopeptide/dipeptide ABC transporter ATP-binding protein